MQQVGHISAGSASPNLAACLAPILDFRLQDPGKPNIGAIAEAVSIQGVGTQFSSMCTVTLVRWRYVYDYIFICIVTLIPDECSIFIYFVAQYPHPPSQDRSSR